MSMLKENLENAISGKQKDSVQKEMLAASEATIVLSCSMTADTKVFQTGNLPEVVVLLERDTRNRADITSKETVRIRCVIISILPCLNYNSESG